MYPDRELFINRSGTGSVWPAVHGRNPDLRKPGLDPDIRRPGLDPDIRRLGLDPDVRRLGLDSDIRRLGLDPEFRRPGLEPDVRRSGLEGLNNPRPQMWRRRNGTHSSQPDLLEPRTEFRSRRYGSSHNLGVRPVGRPSPAPVSVSTRPRRGDNHPSLQKGERMVTIRCERLSSEREYEQVEIEIPLSVYNNMQRQQTRGVGPARAARTSSSSCRRGIVHKLLRIFAKG